LNLLSIISDESDVRLVILVTVALTMQVPIVTLRIKWSLVWKGYEGRWKSLVTSFNFNHQKEWPPYCLLLVAEI